MHGVGLCPQVDDGEVERGKEPRVLERRVEALFFFACRDVETRVSLEAVEALGRVQKGVKTHDDSCADEDEGPRCERRGVGLIRGSVL